ncbi:MAG: 2,3-diphosphoglycerate-dependent phosphoglycerate mutase [Candidatus Paceibacterota bacterium]|jgi:2,3-bisphosphoglycerate-dependent phosphoglycerate mutase
MYKLVIVRHGESIWNKKNIFTGWTDVELSELGREQAKKAGEILLKEKYVFDIAFTSVLKRAQETLQIILNELNLVIPIEKCWRLNERHYGSLQGMDKDEIKEKYGEDLFKQWRRSYDVRPPSLVVTDARYPGNDPKYSGLSRNKLPQTESLKDTELRLMPYWTEGIIPKILDGKKVLICAHGNSIRALVKIIENINSEDILNVEIPLAQPLVYEFDENMKMINKFYL